MAEKPYNDKESLRQFADQLQGLLDQYQSNRLVDAESKKHQKELEKLLSTTNKILSEQASKTEVKDFNKLLKQSEDSYRILKENHKEDKKFKDQFTETFGKQANAGSISQAVAKHLKGTLSDVSKATAQSTQNLRRESGNASLQYLTGPIGAMFRQYVDTSGFKNLAKEKYQQHKENRQARSSQDTQRPTQAREKPFGTLGYNAPDQQEKGAQSGVYGFNSENKNRLFENYNTNTSSNRAIAGSFSADRSNQSSSIDNSNKISTINQNVSSLVNSLGNESSGQSSGNGLTGGGSDESNRLVKVYSEGHSKGFFDPLIETENSLYDQEQQERKTFSERLFSRLKFLHKTIAFTGKKTSEATLFAVQVWWKKFQEHPIFHTLRIMAKPLTSTLLGIKHYLFGRRKDDTEKIVQSNEDIVDILTKGTKEADKTGFQKGLKNFINFGGHSRAQKRFDYLNLHPDEKRSLGQRIGDKATLMGYRKYLDDNTVKDRRKQGLTDGLTGKNDLRKVVSIVSDIHKMMGGDSKYRKEELHLQKKEIKDIKRNHRSSILKFLGLAVSSLGSLLGTVGLIYGALKAIKSLFHRLPGFGGKKPTIKGSQEPNEETGKSGKADKNDDPKKKSIFRKAWDKTKSVVGGAYDLGKRGISKAYQGVKYGLGKAGSGLKGVLTRIGPTGDVIAGDAGEFALGAGSTAFSGVTGMMYSPSVHSSTLSKAQIKAEHQRWLNRKKQKDRKSSLLTNESNNVNSLSNNPLSFDSKIPTAPKAQQTAAFRAPTVHVNSNRINPDDIAPKVSKSESSVVNDKQTNNLIAKMLSQTQQTANNTKKIAESLSQVTSNQFMDKNGHLETLDQILNITPTWNVTN